MPVDEAELLEGDDRLGGCELEGYSVALAAAFCKGTGVNAEVEACISLVVYIVQVQLCIVVAYLARQRGAEYGLRVAGGR